MEAQCEICHQEAASAQQNLKLATWQKLTTLISGLQQLQAEDARVGRWVKSLMDSREPLNVALEDDESRFEKALAEGRFSQAVQLLQKAGCLACSEMAPNVCSNRSCEILRFRKVPSRQRHADRLMEHLLDAMSSASKRMHDDTEAVVFLVALATFHFDFALLVCESQCGRILSQVKTIISAVKEARRLIQARRVFSFKCIGRVL